MSFAQAHDFTIENLYAVDESGGNELRTLAQVACLGAGHQSEERYDAPKCHPETRKAVINDIMSWVDSNESIEPMMWMSGPAGAGKSSIAQTVCERCHDEGKLLASFFFSRNAVGTGRDNGSRLVPTIAVQLAIALPDTKGLIIDTLKSNPTLLSYSMEVLMEKLVLDPITQVSSQEFSGIVASRQRYPYLIVIDGLDECKNPQMQARIITMISASLSTRNISLRFLFASRPELEIRNTFNSPAVSERCSLIVLNETYNPHDDIRVYLQSEFSSLIRGHHLKSLRSHESLWPSSYEIHWLVEKSSGQFIYASTIMKYLKHPRRDPRTILASIISAASTDDVQSKQKESPFAELDTLYRHILHAAVFNLQCSSDSIINVFQVLLFAFEKGRSNNLKLPSNLASFLLMDLDELEILLSDLHSILFIPESVQVDKCVRGKGSLESLLDSRPIWYIQPPNIELPSFETSTAASSIRFYHASFGDFLKSMSRSMEFFIDETEAHTAIAHHCFSRLMEYKSSNKPKPAERYSRNHYFSHIKNSGYNGDLLRELNSSQATMRNILDLLIQYNDSSHAHVDHVNQGLECVFEFDFDSPGSCFALPANNEVQKICSAMNPIVDDLILSAYQSVDLAETKVLVSITENIKRQTADIRPYYTKTTSLILSWLAMLLENPQRGKHLYLDTGKSLRLYYKICSDSEFRESCGVSSCESHILQYLLAKIEPSADLDVDQFQTMSNNLIDEIGSLSAKRRSKICLEGYIQKCLVLKSRKNEP